MTRSVVEQPRWRTELGWFFMSRSPPVLDGELVVVRCGPSVVALERGSGVVRWQTEIEPGGGDESFFLALGAAGWATDVQRHPARLTSVVAIGPDGAQRWRADLPAIAAPRGGIMAGDSLILPATQPGGGGQRLIEFPRPASGGDFENHALAWGVSRAVRAGGGLVVANAMGGDQGRGLYRMAIDGSDPVILAAAGAVDVAVAGGDRVLAALKEPGGLTAAMVGAADGVRRWAVPISAPWVAADGERVVTVEDRRPVCRDAGDGSVRWTGEPLGGDTGSLAIAGGLVFAGAGRTRVILDLAGGAVLGTLPGGFGPVAVDEDALFLAGDRAVLCLPRPGGAA